jgi:hypothetical protein
MAYVVAGRGWARAGRGDRVVEVLEELARASNGEAGSRRHPGLLDDRDRGFFPTVGSA